MNRKGATTKESVWTLLTNWYVDHPNKAPLLRELAQLHQPTVSCVTIYKRLKELAAEGRISINTRKKRGITLLDS